MSVYPAKVIIRSHVAPGPSPNGDNTWPAQTLSYIGDILTPDGKIRRNVPIGRPASEQWFPPIHVHPLKPGDSFPALNVNDYWFWFYSERPKYGPCAPDGGVPA